MRNSSWDIKNKGRKTMKSKLKAKKCHNLKRVISNVVI